MDEKLDHCNVALKTSPVKSVVFSDQHLQNNVDEAYQQRPTQLLIEDQYTDSNADVESNADSENDELLSPYPSVHSNMHGGNSKMKLLGSPLTALTFPPPPPVEDEDFDEEQNDVPAESLFLPITDAELSITAEKIVAAAINEAVLVEKIVSMAMKDAVASIISLIHQFEEQESEKIAKDTETAENTDQETKSKATESQTNDEEDKEIAEETADSADQKERKISSQQSSPSKEIPVEENIEKKELDGTNSIVAENNEEELLKTHDESKKQIIEVPAEENTQNLANEPINPPKHLDSDIEPSSIAQHRSDSESETQNLEKIQNETENSPKSLNEQVLCTNEKADKLASNTEEVEVEINYRAEETSAHGEKLENEVATAEIDNVLASEALSLDAQTAEEITTNQSPEAEDKTLSADSTQEAETKPLLVDSTSEAEKKTLPADSTEEAESKPLLVDSTPKQEDKTLPADSTPEETSQNESQLNSSSINIEQKEVVLSQNETENKNDSNDPAAVESEPKPETQTSTPSNPVQTEKHSELAASTSAANPAPETVKKSGCCNIL